jgi:cell division protein FtsB
MEIWNREQLYAEIWESPLVKLAVKYGISAVALGKVCRKLQIPLPGRGYWVKKDFGKPVIQIPLPEAKNLPIVHRMKQSPAHADEAVQKAAETNPDDPELARIAEVEAKTFSVAQEAKPHQLVSAAQKILRRAQADERGILHPLRAETCLDIRVSKSSLDRALSFVNAILRGLEAENFSVTVKSGVEGTGAEIFGQRVAFVLIEKSRVKTKREVKEYSWTRTITEYEPTGELEFRVSGYGHGFRKTWSDGKTRKIETLLTHCLVALMREARYLRIQAELFRQREIERRKKEDELAKLSQLIAEEEKNISDLDKWVTAWARAEQIRNFVVALEQVWIKEGHYVSPEAPKGQRLVWMRQQAERLDPMIPSPPSIVDRKGELPRW